MSSNTTQASSSGVSDAQLIIDLTQTDLPATTPVYIYVVGLVSGTSDIYYYLDNDFTPQIMATSDNTQAAQTFPGMSQLSTEAQQAIAPNYPLAWADWSIEVEVGSSLILNLGAINKTNIPTLSTGTSAFSGRIYISVGVPKLPFTVQKTGYTAPVFGGSSGISGSLTQYDWIEFSYDSLGNFNGNTTQVNQFGFPLMLTGTPVGGQPYPTQGTLNITGNAILSAIAAANAPLGGATVMTPVPVGCAAAYPTGTNYLRAISPTTASGDINSSLNTYFDANIKTAYKAWQSTPLVTIDLSSGPYTGVVFPVPAVNLLEKTKTSTVVVKQSAPANYPPGSLAFYKGNYPTLVDLVTELQSSNTPAFFLTGSTQNTISSNDIWQCANSLACGDTAQKNVGKMIAAAFNRGIMVDPDGIVLTSLNDGTCATLADTFYPASGTFNAWADAFHDYNRNGLAYGFPYDDVCDQNPSIPPSGDTLVASFIRIALGTFGIPTLK
ncbi:MAG: Tat pathway signal protein [Methylococcaceae bacterium]|nr:Tat pathway signal protein [Methylococcaceae bacterium]